MNKYDLKLITDYNRRKRENKNKTFFKKPFVYSTKDLNQITKKESYHNWLTSPYWAKQRARVLRIKGRKCAMCKASLRLNIHHISYENAFNQDFKMWINDVVVLCSHHHELFHKLYGVKQDMKAEWKEFKNKFFNK